MFEYAPAPESRSVVDIKPSYGLFVDGTFVDPVDGGSFKSINPASEEVLAEIAEAGNEDVDRAVRAARQAYEKVWGPMPGRDRAKYLFRIARIIQERSRELAVLESLDNGKPIRESRDVDVPLVAAHFFYYAGWADKLEYAGFGGGSTSRHNGGVPQPLGVAAQVIPWNFPLLMLAWKIAPALAAGNTVVLKPSDTTPASTLLLAELAADVLPPGVLNVVCGDRDTGRALVAHPRPDLVAITGSVRAGSQVAREAAADLKRVHLELGGKAPAVVFADADLEAAAAGIAGAGYYNAGQDCTAAARVLVHASVRDEFAQALAEQARAQRTGPPHDPDADYGPLNNEQQLERVLGFLDRLPAHARVLAGGSRVGEVGYFLQATVVDGLRQDDEAVQDEVFGPVITVQSFEDEAEAVALANGVRYGLASSVWTRDHSTAMRMSRALDFGVVWVNTHIPFVAEMPHGGFKHSGYGKDLSVYGFEDYTRVKHVMSAIEG